MRYSTKMASCLKIVLLASLTLLCNACVQETNDSNVFTGCIDYDILLNVEHDYNELNQGSDYKFINTIDEWNNLEPTLFNIPTNRLLELKKSLQSFDFNSNQILYLQTIASSGNLSFVIDVACDSSITAYIGWCEGQGGDSAYHSHTMFISLPKGDYKVRFDSPRQIDCK